MIDHLTYAFDSKMEYSFSHSYLIWHSMWTIDDYSMVRKFWCMGFCKSLKKSRISPTKTGAALISYKRWFGNLFEEIKGIPSLDFRSFHQNPSTHAQFLKKWRNIRCFANSQFIVLRETVYSIVVCKIFIKSD